MSATEHLPTPSEYIQHHLMNWRTPHEGGVFWTFHLDTFWVSLILGFIFVGVFANVFGAGYPRNFVPDFAWGGVESGYRTYRFSDACETAERVMARRNLAFNELDKAILFHVYDRSAKHRSWEK